MAAVVCRYGCGYTAASASIVQHYSRFHPEAGLVQAKDVGPGCLIRFAEGTGEVVDVDRRDPHIHLFILATRTQLAYGRLQMVDVIGRAS